MWRKEERVRRVENDEEEKENNWEGIKGKSGWKRKDEGNFWGGGKKETEEKKKQEGDGENDDEGNDERERRVEKR